MELGLMSTRDLYNNYRDHMQKIADLRYSNAVLQWDQETYMPKGGAANRGRQVATLSETAHEWFTAEKTVQLLAALLQRTDLPEDDRRNVELTRYDLDKAVKLPASFVRRQSEAVNKAFHLWLESRQANRFAIFEPALEVLVELKREEAALLGYEAHPYDALLNDYEKGCTVAFLDEVFGNLKAPLQELIDRATAAPLIDNAFLHQFIPKEKQWAFSIDLLQKMGFDSRTGRQDMSEHPFTTSFSSQDVRITTRIDEQDIAGMIWSTIHELGHAFYEQGLPGNQYGLPLGEYCSLGIHESQSRLWENCVGRSLPFCKWLLPLLQAHFPENFKGVSAEQLFRAINHVKSSLIRTESDELTYHFHVIIRYEIEKQLIEGSLKVKDVPVLWDELYKKYLGITVPDDKQGCLQDVHWSHGSFGYFPTYSLGSLWAAQIFEKMGGELPHLLNEIENGEFSVVLKWLRGKIHEFGRKFASRELTLKITGAELDTASFFRYAIKKHATGQL